MADQLPRINGSGTRPNSVGYLRGAADRHPQPTEALEGALGRFRELAAADPRAAATHLALDAALAEARGAIAAFAWGPGEEGERWRRDVPLLSVAEAARWARTEAALRGMPS